MSNQSSSLSKYFGDIWNILLKFWNSGYYPQTIEIFYTEYFKSASSKMLKKPFTKDLLRNDQDYNGLLTKEVF